MTYKTDKTYGTNKRHGGYRKLKSWQSTTIIYDLTVEFCNRYMTYPTNKSHRTYDQMVQVFDSEGLSPQAQTRRAARSGRQNIAEGSQASATSKKTELKLVSVARASLEELLNDYQDFLRQRGLALWNKDDPRAKAIRNLAYASDTSYKTYQSYLSDPENVANCLICLIHQANYLLDRQLQSLEKAFVEEGGFSENLLKKRLSFLGSKKFQGGFLRVTKKSLITMLAVWIAVTGSGLLYLFGPWNKQSQAAWFDDTFAFRKAIILTDTAAETNKYATLSSYDASDTTKYQSDCGDVLFTDQSGNLLTYTVTSCGASTTFHINMDTIISGTQTIYLYYGNPAAADGFASSDPYAACATCSFGSPASEEKGPGPTLYWRFDDPAVSSVIQDSTTNGLDGTLNNTPSFQTEGMCLSGKCYLFDGTNNESVSIADDAKLDFAAADNFTLSAWVKRNGASSANTIILGKASANIGSTYQGYKLYQDASGDFCFDTQDGTLAVDTACTSGVNFDDDKWHLVQGVKTGTTSITLYVDGNQRAQDASIASTGSLANAGTFYAGIDSDGLAIDWKGFIDEVKVYPYARSADQVKADFASRGSSKGVSLSTQGDTLKFLSDGLVGYWKMDESSWTNDCSTTSVTDSSGNGNNGKACPATTGPTGGATGKFGNAGSLDGTDDYVDLGNPSMASSIQTISAWIYPTTVSGTHAITAYTQTTNFSNDFIIRQSGATISIIAATSGGSICGNLTSSSVLTTNTWFHVVVTYADSIGFKLYINGNLHKSDSNSRCTNGGNSLTIGAIRWNSSSASQFFTGTIDEVRYYNRVLSSAEVSQLYNFAPSPVAYWKMEEGTGTTISDSSGNANTSSAFTGNVAWTNGKFGKGLSFDGNDDAVPIPETTYTDLGATTDSYTVSAWINTTTNFSGAGGAIVSKNPGTGGSYPYQIRLNSSEVGCFDLLAPSAVPSACGTTTLNDGRWHHLVGIRDVPSDTLYIYIDGRLEGSTNDTSISSAANDESIYIGTNTGLTTDFNGKIDEVKIYNYARSSKQIIEDMNASHPAPGSPVGSAVGHWKFDEGALNSCSGGANDFCDSSINANDLTFSTTTGGYTNSGKFGKAFSGADNTRATKADDADFDFAAADDFSISGWFLRNNNTATEYVIHKQTGDIGYAVYLEADGDVVFGIGDGAVAFPEETIGGNLTKGYDNNAWHHFVAVKEGTSAIRLYVDGQQIASDTSLAVAGTLANTAQLIVADANTTDGTDEFLGSIDELKIYRGALTAEEVKLDYNRSQSIQFGALSDNASAGSAQATSQEYCIPGDSTSCAGPVAEWKMEEASTTSFDTSGNGNNIGWFNNTQAVPGKMGKAKQPTSLSDFGSVTDAAVLRPGNGSWTVSVWAKPANINQAAGIITKKAGDPTYQGFRLCVASTVAISTCSGSGKKIAFDFTESNVSAIYRMAVTTDDVADGNWHHIVAVADKAADTIYIYVDGVKKSTTDTNSGVWPTVDNTTNISFATITGSTFYNGAIDTVRIYNYARTAAQVAWDYNKGAPVAHWKMDECQGTTINDSSGNGNTGTLTVGATGTQTSAGNCTTVDTATAWYNGKTGKYNYSLNLDGTNDYVSRADDADFDFAASDNFSISLWAKSATSTNPASGNYLLSKYNVGGGSAAGYSIHFRDSTGEVQFTITDGTNIETLRPTTDFYDANWHHIVASKTGTSRIDLYVDGILRASDTSIATTGTLANSTNLSIGATTLLGTCCTSVLNGQIDDVKIFNYALTATQVQQVYNSGAVRFGPSTGAP